ncbi:MAG TPA: serine--tRNA ligase [Alphaproteobacteria bacterium]|nr:serine--tRNA ligase [Alphaproteobacteria bacterium]
MHDIRFIRDNPQAFDAGLSRRGLEPLSAAILELDARRRTAQTRAQEMLARRNQASKEIGQRKAKKEDAADLMAEVQHLKDQITATEAEEKDLAAALDKRLAEIPNLPASDVPDGADAAANVEVRRWGTPPKFEFAAKDHSDLGEALKLMDSGRGAKLSGARFTVLSGQLARLHRALGQFMLDLHTREFGYTEIDPPLLVRDQAMYGTGQLPKFADDLFHTTTDYWLIPTAEVSLTNLVAEEILEESSLPRRYTALTACFRAEAGAAGKDTRGMLRQHQFYKVELVSVAHPDQSNAEHERMTGCAEEVLKRLELPYRTMVLCTGDMGFGARKTYDIEVWLPGQNTYREISSCSNCGDFQARRMNARFRKAGEKGTQFVHTLNGSGLAVGRALIAVIENYQQGNGSIRVPEALTPYMGGIDVIGA